MNAVIPEDLAFWTDFMDFEILIAQLAGPIGTFMNIISITLKYEEVQL
jgi:hypothetical protein